MIWGDLPEVRGNATYALKASLFQLFQHPCQSFQVARVGIDIKHLSVAVDEAVGGEGLHVEEVLHRALLVCGQVVMHHVVTQDVVLFDDNLPRLVLTSGID